MAAYVRAAHAQVRPRFARSSPIEALKVLVPLKVLTYQLTYSRTYRLTYDSLTLKVLEALKSKGENQLARLKAGPDPAAAKAAAAVGRALWGVAREVTAASAVEATVAVERVLVEVAREVAAAAVRVAAVV